MDQVKTQNSSLFKIARWVVGCWLALSLLASATVAGHAQSQVINNPETAPAEVAEAALKRTDIEHWADNFMSAAERRGQFVGAAIAIITPRGPVFIRGYGYGDYEQSDPVHPEVTFLPIGELGNLFVAEALIDLQDAQRLALDQPANDFLTRITLPPVYRDLKTRDLFGDQTRLTASLRGTEVKRSNQEIDNIDQLKSMLRRSALERPSLPVRSALGQAIAGLVLEDVTGKKLDDLIAERLKTRYGAYPFLNGPGGKLPKYTARHHRLSKFGEIKAETFLASAPGFLPVNGIYLTASDLASILSRTLGEITTGDARTTAVADMVFDAGTLEGPGGLTVLLRQSSRVSASTIEVSLMPELGFGIIAIVNSAAKTPDVTPRRGRTPMAPPISASDITNGFLNQFLVPKRTEVASNSARSLAAFEGTWSAASLPLVGPDRILELLTPKVRVRATGEKGLYIDGDGVFRSDASRQRGLVFNNKENGRTVQFFGNQMSSSQTLVIAGNTLKRFNAGASLTPLAALFLMSLVLQFAIVASARWPVTSGGQRFAKYLGMISVVAMTAALTLPVALLLVGHSRTLVDPAYTVATWAFPLASLLALSTLIAAILAWRGDYWSGEGFGVQRRICFSVGSLGLFGLVLVGYQMNLAAL